MYLLGYDIGSSSVKASLLDAATGNCIASSFFPKKEMAIKAIKSGWAEQHPDDWYANLKLATHDVMAISGVNKNDIKAIGISYQMHGLVCVDKNYNVLRPAIIWCDSRAVSIGEKAFQSIGANTCLPHLLNSPGNFTASKLKWVQENEPELYSKIYKIMLPGDYIAYRLTGNCQTTISGLSEGMFWDFKQNQIADFLLQHYKINSNLIPEIVPTFSIQGNLTTAAANELGLSEKTVVSYRAGDQPNNALSLNVLHPGEIAATAGTSGVVYGISETIQYDPLSRINTFAHVNHSNENKRLGVLLCINGTGILNSWIKKYAGFENLSYEDMNIKASYIKPGSDGLSILPFGNGAERLLNNQNRGCSIHGLNFNIHNNAHLSRAAQEGIVFAFYHGINVMKETGIESKVIKAGNANMFLSPVFREALATITQSSIELYNTDGSQGSARGAGIGCKIYASEKDAFSGLKKISVTEPSLDLLDAYNESYQQWNNYLTK